jgi:predicted nuclease with TOPRIM domain
MSKVQEKEATFLSNLSGSEIANELDSRLRDLEKNIAVAREFIKLADESYSELRHKWNLLHEEVRNKPETNTIGGAIVADEKRETRPRNKKQSKTRETKLTELNKPESPISTDISAKPEGHPRHIKTTNRSKKEPEISSKDADSIPPDKPYLPYRDPGRRRGRTSGHN